MKEKGHLEYTTTRFPWWLSGELNLPMPTNAANLGSIPGSGRSPGEGSDNPLQNFCLENPMDRGAWRASVNGVAKSWT